MSDTTFGILFFADLVVGFLIWLYLTDYFNKFRWWKAALIKSSVYCLFFGIGFLGKGGDDPGFMLPCPILPAAIVSATENDLQEFVQNALVPYGFWTVVVFIFYSLRQALRYVTKSREGKF
jgi:hypothetical protein